jgi:hypothetical protein
MSEKKNEQDEKWAKFSAALTRKLLASGKFEIGPNGWPREIRKKK